MQDRAPLTDLINAEPAIFQGMTVTEAKVIGAVSMVLFLTLGTVLFAMTGFWQFIVVCGIFGPLVLMWFASAQLAMVKRGRPDGYYSQAIHLWLTEKGLGRSHFIRHNGYWALGRTLDFSLSAPYEFPSAESFKQPLTDNSVTSTPKSDQEEHENH
ncbi:TIGR03750 family conjugal transfer protein [Lampropedia puyangensis]|uniref:TIGR03750 family conjugal transfer protein n=1 Tax=Lampropedia puyangensis TaxID=1330072 RepID=A0A4S8EX10_9BURK|nr:TIGR03750 family conjugal transfer protein [Lampropedia puyangensis]THT98404.1 TIGR03750 family conjugal transfer protein [Lampropedia puyangensis]